MKKYRLVLVILALLLVFSLAFISCDDGTTNGGGNSTKTKFEGRWWAKGYMGVGYTDYSFTFSGNNFVFRSVNLDGNPTNNRICTGTFTFTDTYFTWIPTEGENWTSYSQTYQLINNGRAFNLGNSPSNNYSAFSGAGMFEKQ